MDYLSNDMTHEIFQNLSEIDKLNLYPLFKEQRPSQFKVSREVLLSKKLKGPSGLHMLAYHGHDDAYHELLFNVLWQTLPHKTNNKFEKNVRLAVHKWTDDYMDGMSISSRNQILIAHIARNVELPDL